MDTLYTEFRVDEIAESKGMDEKQCWMWMQSALTGRYDMKDYRRAGKTVDVSVGESVRIIRELQGPGQNDLADLTGIPRSTNSAIENDRVHPGVERAKVLGRAPQCHPAVLVFPGWDTDSEVAA